MADGIVEKCDEAPAATKMDKEYEMYEWMLKTCDQRLNLCFSNLTYNVSKRKSVDKCVLKSVSGTFKSGRLTAILGPSGAGKTSLLNVLSGVITVGVHGSITVNGRPRSLQQFKRQSCYIEQECSLFHLLNVSETLKFAADLKLGPLLSSHKKNVMVQEVMDLLGLEKSSTTLVKKLSGGEKKRLSIGLELLTNPPVMFFDEPTSGLDTTSSVHMINHLKNLAARGRTVVCVIHQPSSQLFDIFDDVFIVARGEIIYGGATSEMISAFADVGFQCPNFYNPADFVIELVSTKEQSLMKSVMQKKNEKFSMSEDGICDFYNSSKIPKENKLPVYSDTVMTDKNIGAWYQFWILLKRSIKCRLRDMNMTYARIVCNAIVGGLMGILYYNIGNDADKVLTNIPCLFFFVYNFFFISMLMTVLSFPEEEPIIKREYQNNWYSLESYYFSKLLSDIPLQFICPTLFIVCAYFLSGQPPDRIFLFWGACMLLVMMGETFGLIFGTLFKRELAIFMILIVGTLIGLFSGFLVRLRDVPTYLQWVTYLSCLRYAFEAVMISIYGFDRENLECNEIYCYFHSPRKVLEEMHMSDGVYLYAMGGIVLWTIIYKIIFYASLRFKLRRLR